MKKFIAIAATALTMCTMVTAPAIVNKDSNISSSNAIIQSISSYAAGYSTGTYQVNTSSGVNVRSGAGSGYSKLGAATNGTQFKVTKVSGDWGYGTIKCTNGNKTGWVCLTYTKLISADTSASKYKTGTFKVNTSEGVNVRSGAGTGYSKVGAATNGTQFNVTKVSGDWGYTNSIKCTNGTKSGWVCLTYAKSVSPDNNNSSSNTNNNSSSNGKVSLNVPYYSQGDSRWKNVALGKTDTIGRSGCIVTSIAMAYSYNQHSTVYPDAVKKKLSFTNSGDIYWSSVSNCGMKSYSKGGVSINQSIMNEIYNKLKSGKPVVMWCTNSNGKAHAVCITGYNGSTSSFSASNFTIKDPGWGRTNLQQHLNYVNKVQYLIY
ncbi:MAG: SH3 domain-containing protein [Oscillospiraceae bacterium]|nr:SH3 domain-containing protein [Oscillospiraceae bacterium]